MRTGRIFLKLIMTAAAGIGIGFLLTPGRAARAGKSLLEKGGDYLKGAANACKDSLTDLKHVLNPVSDKRPGPETELPIRQKERAESKPGTNGGNK